MEAGEVNNRGIQSHSTVPDVPGFESLNLPAVATAMNHPDIFECRCKTASSTWTVAD